MDVDERQRYQLHQTLERELGSDAAATLMSLLPPVGWADVATKHDLAVLRQDLDGVEQRLGLRMTAEIAGVRTEIAEVRGELHRGLAEVRTEIAGVRTEIHTTARAMTFAIVGATAAIVGTTAVLTGLFG